MDSVAVLAQCASTVRPWELFLGWAAILGTVRVLGSEPKPTFLLKVDQLVPFVPVLLVCDADRACQILAVVVGAEVDLDELGAILVVIRTVDYGNVTVAGHRGLCRVQAVETKLRSAHKVDIFGVRIVERLVSSLPVRLNATLIEHCHVQEQTNENGK